MTSCLTGNTLQPNNFPYIVKEVMYFFEDSKGSLIVGLLLIPLGPLILRQKGPRDP